MKKMLAILLTLCMLLPLSACGGEKGIPFVNAFGCELEGVYIVPTGTGDWGNKKFGPMGIDRDAYIYGEQTFGVRELTVDIMVKDMEDNQYEVYGVPIRDGDRVVLKPEGEDGFTVTVNDDADFYGQKISAEQPTPISEMDVVGIWEYEGADRYLIIYNGREWAQVTADVELVAKGYQSWSYDCLSLCLEDSMVFADVYSADEKGGALPSATLRVADQGLIHYVGDLGADDYQYLLEYETADAAHFEEMGYEVNYRFGESGTYMPKGAYSYTNDEFYYDAFPATVSIDLISYNDTGDGYAEVEFEKTTWFDRDDYPDFMFENKFIIATTQNLYDYYTGYHLPDSAIFGNSDRGDNYYYYEYESQGRTICVDYNYSADWERLEDTSYVFRMEFFVRMPIDYDGIVFAHLEAAPTIDELHSYQSDPGDTLTAIEDPRLENAVICKVNDPQR